MLAPTRRKQKPGQEWKFRCGHSGVLPDKIGELNEAAYWHPDIQCKTGGSWICRVCANTNKRKKDYGTIPYIPRQKPGQEWKFLCGHSGVLPEQCGESNEAAHWKIRRKSATGGCWECRICKNVLQRNRRHAINPDKRQKLRASHAAYQRKERATLRGSITSRLRSSMRSCIKRRGTFSILPFTRDELCAHIRSELQRYNGRCPMCNIDITYTFDIDHRVPLSSAGNDEASILQLFELSNLSVLCANCNRNVKRAKLVSY